MIVQTHSVNIDTKAGPMRTHIHRPQAAQQSGDGARAGIVMFSEIFQQTAPIARMATMIAGHGFVVAVPEIFHELEPAGTVLPYDERGTNAGNRHKTEKRSRRSTTTRVPPSTICSRATTAMARSARSASASAGTSRFDARSIRAFERRRASTRPTSTKAHSVRLETTRSRGPRAFEASS